MAWILFRWSFWIIISLWVFMRCDKCEQKVEQQILVIIAFLDFFPLQFIFTEMI